MTETQRLAANILQAAHALLTSPPCQRCNGTGYLPAYRHVEDGVCFKCGGIGVDISTVKQEKDSGYKKQLF